ncbi:MAG: hypothetical protein M9899_11055 [Bdellovibrionaceae bacterium]|nr:hypothetical protein [Pseudobdellovibrionaceae bacterium]
MLIKFILYFVVTSFMAAQAMKPVPTAELSVTPSMASARLASDSHVVLNPERSAPTAVHLTPDTKEPPVTTKVQMSQHEVMGAVSKYLKRPLILVFDEECKSCVRLVKKMGKECKNKEQLNKNVAVLAFGDRQKIRAKLVSLKGIQTQIYDHSRSKVFLIEATPSLWIEDQKQWKYGVKDISTYLWDKTNELCHS